MPEASEVTQAHTPTHTPLNGQPTQPGSHQQHAPSQNNTSPPSTASSHLGHEAAFVRPSDLLRPKAAPRPTAPPPQTQPQPESQIDRDEREGLQAIRNFLRARRCYDVLPLSFRLIELDVGLTVKESLQIMVQCGTFRATRS